MFTQLVTHIGVKYYDELKGRIKISKKNKSKGKCASCDCKLENKFHTDHIIPLSNNGIIKYSSIVCWLPYG
jgi:hypothetical protein